MAVPPPLVRIPSQRPLALSVASVMSVANDMSDNEMILRATHRSPSIYLIAEENPGKPQLGSPLIKFERSVIASNGIHFLQIRPVGSHSTSKREKEGNKERIG